MGPKSILLSGVSRRKFLQAGLGVGAGVLLPQEFGHPAWAAEDLPTRSYRLLRYSDFLNVEVRFVNFRLTDQWLEPLGLGQSSVVVVFPPQNLAEAIFDERHNDPDYENDPIAGTHASDNDRFPPIQSFISGPSWVVFDVPDHAAPFDLMNPESWWPRLERLALRVPRGAIGPSVPQMPSSRETALELPFRLYISPGPNTRFAASLLPKPDSGNAPVELWNASLTSRTAVVPAGLPPGTPNVPEELAPPKRVVLQARAVYSPDYQRKSEPRFALYYPAERPLSLHALTRHRLVKQMSEGDGQIDIEHLVLTALGADANFYYASRKTVDQIIQEQVAAADDPTKNGDPGTELRMWKHRIVIGRDVFFVEAFFGFLFPFCHPAIYVELTQRKFVSYTDEVRKPGETQAFDAKRVSAPGAYLLKRRFILVQDPLKNFAGSDTPVGRMMPTKRVTLRTVRSPDLADPVMDPNPNDKTGLYFWPRLETSNDIANWETEVEDESGQTSITTGARLWFASNIVKGHKRYQVKTAADRTIPFPSSKIAFAPEAGPSKGIAPKVSAKLAELSKTPPKNVNDAAAAIRNVVQEAVTDLEKQTQKIADIAQSLLTEFDQTVTKGAKTVDDLLAAADRYAKNLGQRNDLGSTLETKAITFASNFVRDEVAIAARVIPMLANIQSIGDITKQLKTPQFDVFDAYARNRLTDGINALMDASNALKIKDAGNPDGRAATPDETLKDFVVKTQSYLAAYQAFNDKANALGSGIFHTGIDGATVVIPAVKGLLPNAPDRDIALIGEYITGGFANAQNGVYASLTEAIGKAEDIGGQIRNGLSKPSMVISGISRELGAVASDSVDKVKDIARTDFNQFKQDLSDAIPDAKLFGVIPLRKIVDAVSRGQMPDINVVELPEKIVRTWTWAAPVKEQNFGILTFSPKMQPVGLFITSTTTVTIPKPKDLVKGVKPLATVDLYAFLGHMKPATAGKTANVPDDGSSGTPGTNKDRVFAVNLLDLIEVEISELSVRTSYTVGQPVPKPNVKPILALKPVEFLGPLSFLGALQNGLSFGGLTIAIDPDFVSARSNLTIPPIAFGAFSCRNLALKSGISLPLGDRTLRYDFAFSSFEKPFELSVMGFAGRGYFGAAFESNGNRELEGALEFGGALSFDIGIASGGLYVMAGGYLKITNATTELAGYLRAGGALDVLGLVHVSVEFFLALAYRSGDGESVLYGYCEITVSIDMCLYSFDVHVGMEKTISGSKKEQSSSQALKRLKAAAAPKAVAPLAAAAARRYNVPPSQQRVPLYFRRPSMEDGVTGRFNPVTWNQEYWSHLNFVGA